MKRNAMAHRPAPWRPERRRLGGDPTEVDVDPSRFSKQTVNLAILASGVVLGLVGAENRGKSLGDLALQVGGGAAAVALVFFVKDLFSD